MKRRCPRVGGVFFCALCHRGFHPPYARNQGALRRRAATSPIRTAHYTMMRHALPDRAGGTMIWHTPQPDP